MVLTLSFIVCMSTTCESYNCQPTTGGPTPGSSTPSVKKCLKTRHFPRLANIGQIHDPSVLPLRVSELWRPLFITRAPRAVNVTFPNELPSRASSVASSVSSLAYPSHVPVNIFPHRVGLCGVLCVVVCVVCGVCVLCSVCGVRGVFGVCVVCVVCHEMVDTFT